jgi:circadian clock protein KaiB
MSGQISGTEGWGFTPDADAHYVLRLFVAGASSNSVRAITNLRAILAQYVDGRYTLEVIDVRQDGGEIAMREGIIALPTLVKDQPAPSRRLIGDMSDTARVLLGLGITVE